MIGQIRELAGIYRLTLKYKNEFFLEPRKDGSKIERYFDILNSNSTINEDELAKLFYSDGKQDKAYMMLRLALRDRLINYLYLLKPRKVYGSEFMVNYFNAQKGLFLSRALFSLGLYQSGLEVAKKTLISASKIELWDIIVSISSTLSDLFSGRGNEKGFAKYDRISQESIKKLTSERRIRRLVNQWNLHFLKISQASPEDLDNLRTDLKLVKDLARETPTSINTHMGYRIELLYHDACRDYKNAIKVCDDALLFLESRPHFNVPLRQGIYLSIKMYSYLNLRDFKSAREFAELGEKYFVKGTMNWFSSMEYYYVLLIQTTNYLAAYNLITEVVTGNGYKNLPEARKQKWMILEAYMELIISTGIWKDMPNKAVHSKFRVSRFINKVDIFKNDKTGVVVSIIILQILFLIHYGRYTEVIEKREGLSRYIRRYLYTKDHERSRVFLTMLQRVIDADFSYAKTVDKSKRLLAALKSKKVSYVANYGGNEIVDYELLWDWLLNKLKETPHMAEG